MTELKDIDIKILSALMKNAKTSDRKLAKKFGVSQPTITRRRSKLEKEGKLSYRLVPELQKLGFEVMSFIFVIWKPEIRFNAHNKEVFLERVHEFISKNPEIVFASSGEGLEMTRMAITVHRSFSDYVDFRRRFESEWGQYYGRMETFTISLESDQVIQQLTFERLFSNLQ
jgi:DNA-binding Lrp family transcriptional regulator